MLNISTELQRDTQTRQYGPSDVTLNVVGHVLFIFAKMEVLSLLTNCLSEQWFEAVSDNCTGIRVSPVRRPFAFPQFNEAGEVFCAGTFVGFLDDVEAELTRHGVPYEVHRDHSSNLAAEARVLADPETNDELLKYVNSNVRGMIRLPRSPQRVYESIMRVYEAFPSSRIAVVAYYVEDAKDFRRRLHLDNVAHGFAIASLTNTDDQHRMSVSTILGSGQTEIYGPSVDYTFFLHPNQFVLHNYLGYVLREFRRSRIFGVQVDGLPMTESQTTRLKAVFGQSVFCDRDVPAVNVAFVQLDIPADTREYPDLLTARKKLLTGNRIRNAKVAAMALRIGDSEKQKLPGKIAKLLGNRSGRALRVVVVGANKRQVNEMARTILPMHARLCGRQPGKKLNLAVIGYGDLPRFDRDVDVIVRADGGSSDLSDVLTAQFLERRRTPLLVVDLSDDFHPVANQWARLRKAGYIHQGWKVELGPKVSKSDFPTHDSRAGEQYVPYAHLDRAWRPNGEIAKHSRPRRRYLKRRAKHLKDLRGKFGQRIVTLKHIADREILFSAYKKLYRDGGISPGPDRIRATDVEGAAFGAIAGQLAQTILDGRWRHGPERTVHIPKPGGEETRELRLPNLLDRVVGRAVNDTLSRFLEKTFNRNSFGFRVSRNIFQFMARLLVALDKSDRKVVLNLDIRKAFDSVPIEAVLESHRKLKFYGGQRIREEVVQLIGHLLRGADPNRQIGIAQGGCYSPSALNCFLHFAHDVWFTELDVVLPFWFRYADNLVYLTRDETEAENIREAVSGRLAQYQLGIKPGWDIANLAGGGTTELLGFTLSKQKGRTVCNPANGYRDRLIQAFAECWSSHSPYRRSETVCGHWLTQYVPVLDFGGRPDYFQVVTALANEFGFHPDIDRLGRIADNASSTWRAMLTTARRSVGTLLGRCRTSATAPQRVRMAPPC